MPVVMGRKTFESLGKPLAGLKNIVLTKQDGWKADGVVAVKDFNDALFLVKEMDLVMLRWLVVVVVTYAAISLLYTALKRPDAKPEERLEKALVD